MLNRCSVGFFGAAPSAGLLTAVGDTVNMISGLPLAPL